MAIAAAAFPRLSPSGGRVLAGEHEIVIDGAFSIGQGTSGQWSGEDAVFYTSKSDGAFQRWRNGQVSTVRAQGFNAFSVAFGRWVGWRPDTGLVWHDEVVWPGWSAPTLSETRWAALQNGSLLFAGLADGQAGQVVASGAREPRLTGNLLVWIEEDEPHQPRIYGQRSHGGNNEHLSISGERHFWAVPVIVDGQPWVLTHTDDRLLLYPWGSETGYVVARAPTHRPDARQLPDGRVRVVWDAERNVLGEAFIDVRTKPRVLLTKTEPTEPVEDTSGQAIDPLPYMFGELPQRDGSHPMCWYVDHARRRWTEVKFGQADSWEGFSWTNTTISLYEDRSQSEPHFNPPWDYAFTEDVWMTRPMRPGQKIQHGGNRLIRFDPRNNQMVNLPGMAFPYETRLGKVYLSYPFGGAVGTRPAIELEAYALGSPYVERHTYAFGVGRCIWQAIEVATGRNLNKTTFTEIGGPALVPTVGGRDSNPWPPPAQKIGMTIIEPTAYPATASGNRLRVVCGPNPGEHWASWVEWVYRRVGESTWTQQGERRNPQHDDDHTFMFPAAGDYEIGLRWTTGQTGRQRIVRVQSAAPPPDPPQPPQPPAATTMQIQTNDRQHFITVSANGKATATETSADHATVQLTLVRSDDGRFSLRGPNGKVGSAREDGTFTFSEERAPDWKPDAWEALKAEPSSLGGESYVTFHGTRLRAVNQGGSELRHDHRDEAGIDETFWPSVSLTGGAVSGGPSAPMPDSGLDRIEGQLQVEAGGGFVVNGRPVLPILCHFGDAFSRWSRGQQFAVMRDLDDIAAAGYHGIRFWSTLGLDDHGGGYWAGRAVGPTYTPDYWVHLQAFLEALRDRGLVCQFSLGDTRPVAVPDLRAYAYQAGDVINAVGSHVVALGLEVNEDRDTGHQGAAKLAQFNTWFREKCSHVLVGLSAFTGTEDVQVLNDYSRSPADLFVCHGYRGGHWYDKTRHIFSLVYEGKPSKRLGWQGEPAGPGSRVSAIDNRHELDADALCAMASISLMTRQGWVHFSGPGVISDEGERLQDMPGFREVPRVRAMLPTDLMRYDRIFHGGDTWRGERIFAAEGEVRADHAMTNDGRFVALIYGPGPLNVPQTRSAHVDVDHRYGNKARLVVGRAT